jgi:hypothetical protein
MKMLRRICNSRPSAFIEMRKDVFTPDKVDRVLTGALVLAASFAIGYASLLAGLVRFIHAEKWTVRSYSSHRGEQYPQIDEFVNKPPSNRPFVRVHVRIEFQFAFGGDKEIHAGPLSKGFPMFRGKFPPKQLQTFGPRARIVVSVHAERLQSFVVETGSLGQSAHRSLETHDSFAVPRGAR